MTSSNVHFKVKVDILLSMGSYHDHPLRLLLRQHKLELNLTFHHFLCLLRLDHPRLSQSNVLPPHADEPNKEKHIESELSK